ncbi:MAG: amidase [Planctomycetes bacterium]|nr:amidase [Planctomycetota bacterium]
MNVATKLSGAKERPHVSRRRILQGLAAAGVGSVVFRRALAAMADEGRQVTPEMIKDAEWIAGMEYTDEDRKLMLEGVNEVLTGYKKIRDVPLDNGVPPALHFSSEPLAPPHPHVRRKPIAMSPSTASKKPQSEEDLAFAPITELAALIKARQVSSVDLTKMYLARLKMYDPLLHCVITLTEEAALKQAEGADREIAAGQYRGPLHGIPWGVKDLFAYPGYRTTWGATPFQDQVRDEKATVISRLEDAGAVLIAKLSVGALAWGDVWFDATTKNPWNVDQGSSGSSAGPAAATAAGLTGFTIGTETLGSIVSPCTRCGATGLRPTFGRVSRFGCMALTWSMDKVGPIARSVEDCALVFATIHGRDGLDAAAVDRPFVWPPRQDVRSLRVGFIESLFDERRLQDIEDAETRDRVAQMLSFDRRVLDVLRRIGVNLVPIELPDKYPIGPLLLILTAEAATAFDELTRSGRDDELVRQVVNAWPNEFRQGQLIPAVEYLRANRIRTLVMGEMNRLMENVDVYVSPTFGGSNLALTNLTGHPCVVLPHGFRAEGGTPTSITFTGRLHGDDTLLAVAHAFQGATDFHLQRPPLEKPDVSTGQ